MFLFNLFNKLIKQTNLSLLNFFDVFLYGLERLQEDDVLAGCFLVVLGRVTRKNQSAADPVFLNLLQKPVVTALGEGGEMKIDVCGLFYLNNVFYIVQRHIGAKVKRWQALFAKKVVNKQEAKFMVLAFGQEKHKQGRLFGGKGKPFDGMNDFLADDAGSDMLLYGAQAGCLPENAHPLQEGKNHSRYGFFYTVFGKLLVQDLFKLDVFQIDHAADQGIDHKF